MDQIKFEQNETELNLGSFSAILEKSRTQPVDALIVLSGGVKRTITYKDTPKSSFYDDVPQELIDTLEDGDISFDEINERISSTSYEDLKSGFGKAKEIAAIELAKELPKFQGESPTVIVTNSRAPGNDSKLTDAVIMESAIKKGGVDNEIILQENSIDTFTELLEAIKIAQEKGWEHIAIIVTETQAKRARVMSDTILHINNPEEQKKIELMLAYNFNRFNEEKFPDRVADQQHYKESYEYLKNNTPKVEISIVNAEDAIVHRNPKYYGNLMQTIKDNPEYQKKFENDNKDAERWLSGDYTKAGEPFINKWKQ